LEKGS